MKTIETPGTYFKKNNKLFECVGIAEGEKVIFYRDVVTGEDFAEVERCPNFQEGLKPIKTIE